MTLSPVTRGLLRDDVYARLRDAIVDGTLPPGVAVRDIDLAAQLGVSRTPVREALQRLAASGLVETAPGRSTVVTPIDPRRVADAQSVVAAMHRLAVEEAVPRMEPAQLAVMRAANARFARALAEGDVDAALAADDELHAVPVLVSGNTAIAAVLEQLTPVVRRLERLRFASSVGHESVELHARLVDLCEQGRTGEAAEVSHRTWQTLRELPVPDPRDPS